ncbi:LysR family transcriptional regulator [Streptomyces sp. NPDC091217]|uniref:LysR family transcriptional regulator n=1 Tax=Streptomyces sp. NPDC091217 TaxID=3365975 RepID=UPI003818E60F
MGAPRFTLRQLELFVAVARTGSIRAAAEELHCSASAVSAGLTELERALRTELCVRRKSRGVVLTAQGELMRQLANRLLAEASEVAEQMGEAGELRGVLRLGCYAPLAAPFLPALLEAFTRSHPRVEIELFEGTQDDLVSGTLSGDIDLSMIHDEPENPGLATEHVLSRHPFVLVAERHPMAARKSVSLTEFQDEPLVLLDLPPSKRHTLNWFKEAGVKPNIRWQTHDLELVRALVARGLGYAVVLQRQRYPRALDGLPLAALELQPALTPVKVFMIYRAGRSRRRVHAFLDIARAELTSPPAWAGASAPNTGSSSIPAVEVDAVSGGARVDQGSELEGRVLVRPGSPPSVAGDGRGEPGTDGS